MAKACFSQFMEFFLVKWRPAYSINAPWPLRPAELVRPDILDSGKRGSKVDRVQIA
jgi:hypothetical protein